MSGPMHSSWCTSFGGGPCNCARVIFRSDYPPEPTKSGTDHGHDPEACAACRQLADQFFDGGVRAEQFKARAAAPPMEPDLHPVVRGKQVLQDAVPPPDREAGLREADEFHKWLCKTARFSPTGAWGNEVRSRLAALLAEPVPLDVERLLADALAAGNALNLAGGSRNAQPLDPTVDAAALHRQAWFIASRDWYNVATRLAALLADSGATDGGDRAWVPPHDRGDHSGCKHDA